MAIRIRTIDGVKVALCAARSIPKEGDIYIDDGSHTALSSKFALDFLEMGFLDMHYEDLIPDDIRKIVEQEESNNPNREEWEKMFGENGYLNNLI